MKKFCSCILLTVIFAVASAEVQAEIFTSLSALEEAEVFGRDPMFQSVGLLGGIGADGTRHAVGSGVLIDPYWVLTAGHVVQQQDGIAWNSFQFFTNPDALNNLDQVYSSDFANWHPGYLQSQSAGTGDDIGLIRLATPVTGIDPATIYTGDQDLSGIHFTASGFGIPGVWPNTGEFDGVRRAGENFADSSDFGADDQYLISDFDRFASTGALPLEWQASDFDSGAGWFAEMNGVNALIGVHSYSGRSFSGAIGVSDYQDYIQSTISANPPSTAVPEPGSSVLLLSGLIGYALKRKRRST